MMHIISLGAGVQSSTMALMAAHGEIKPMPDCAIFADTGAEPTHVYEQLAFLEEALPFPVHRVMKEDGLEKAIRRQLKDKRFATAPFYTESKAGVGMLRRQCTREYKIEPIEKKIRELLGLKPRQRGPKEVAISQWIGISMDEVIRIKPNPKRYIENRWPLIETEFYRWDCLAWMESHGYPAPRKSACYFCPYHDDKTWLDMKKNDPVSFDLATEIDGVIRNGVRGTKQRLFLHSSMTPIDEVDLDPDKNQIDLFGNECEGMCGL